MAMLIWSPYGVSRLESRATVSTPQKDASTHFEQISSKRPTHMLQVTEV